MKTHVVKTTGEATLAEAADLLDLYQTTGLPVVDSNGVLQGMITESDIVRATARLPGSEAAVHRVSHWMTEPAISVSENADVAEAARLLLGHRLKRLPVVTRTGQVVGVLNRIDLLQAVFEDEIGNVFADES